VKGATVQINQFVRTRSLSITFAVIIVLACAPHEMLCASDTPARGQPDAATKEVSIEFWNREITVLRATIAGADPEMRAERTLERLNALPLNTRGTDIELHPFNVEGQDGMAFTHQGRVLFFLGMDDLDEETGETLAQASQRALHSLDEALNARIAERSWPVIRSALLFTLIGLVILLVIASLIWTAHARLTALLHRREPLVHTPLQLFGIDLRPPIDNLVYAAVRAIAAVFVISAIYSWASLSLRRFPYTQPWGEKLGRYVLQLFRHLGRSAVDSVPGLFAVVVIFFVTRGIVRLARAFFEQVVAGHIRISWLEPETAQATQRIFTGVAWILAIVVAYPYIPGSGTDAFKGISVFVGLMVSLGSTGIINQVMSGLFVVYSRALKPGEWVQVNDVEGEVLQVGLLAGKIRTVEGQEVTMPNSVLVGTATKNHTRLGYPDGMIVSCTVTIGYDAAWRQVEGLLLLAADRTPDVRKEPGPYVLQRELSDFYVAYTLIARITDAKRRMEILSDLHAHVQDAFNEFGVQIMSPHFMMQPQGAVVVPPSKWHAPPAVTNLDKSAQQTAKYAGTSK
jgi:small-conductance mechanosensitive channel